MVQPQPPPSRARRPERSDDLHPRAPRCSYISLGRRMGPDAPESFSPVRPHAGPTHPPTTHSPAHLALIRLAAQAQRLNGKADRRSRGHELAKEQQRIKAPALQAVRCEVRGGVQLDSVQTCGGRRQSRYTSSACSGPLYPSHSTAQHPPATGVQAGWLLGADLEDEDASHQQGHAGHHDVVVLGDPGFDPAWAAGGEPGGAAQGR